MIHSELPVEIIQDTEAFRALEPDWRDLCTRDTRHGFFQTFDWLWRAWTEVASKRGYKLHVLVGRARGQVVLIWPMMQDGRRLRFLGSDQFEYRDLIIDRDGPMETWIEAAWQSLRHTHGIDFVQIEDLRAESNLACFFERHAPSGRKLERSTWLLALDRYRGWDDYTDHLSTQLARNQRRQWRRLERAAGPPVFECVESQGEIGGVLDWLFEHKLRWLETREMGSPRFKSAEYRRFIETVATDLFPAGNLLLATLKVKATPISAIVGYRYGSAFSAHIFAYDQAWHSYSPSRLLLERTIHWCFEHGIQRFDFMPGKEKYKESWGNDKETLVNYLIPLTVRGKALARWYAIRPSTSGMTAWLKIPYRRLPIGVQRVIARALGPLRSVTGHWDELS